MLDVKVFVTAPAAAHASFTSKRIHNYNSAGITVGVSLPCYVEEITEAQIAAEELALTRLAARLPDVIEAARRLSEIE